MRTKKMSMVVLSCIFAVGVINAEKTVKYRAESISCGGCAGKVKKAVNALDGVSASEVNLETKVVSITYDEAKVKPEQIREAINEAKPPVSDYDPNEVIARKATFIAQQIGCGGCASKVKKNISAEAGVISVEADPATKIVNIEYDANKVSSGEFKDSFKKFNYTVSRYSTSEKISYARFNVEEIGGKSAELEQSLKDLKGVFDFTINDKTNTVAIAYNNTLLTEEALAENIKNTNLKLVASK